MSTTAEVVIVGACRTPVGSFQGSLSALTAPKLGAIVIKEALRRAGAQAADVDEVIMGNVLTAGEGQAPARQAALFAGLPQSVECMTINKVCGSGLKAVMLAAQAIQLGHANVIVAGGMESMSNVPYILDKARSGYRLGHGQIVDAMIKDGLWDVYNDYHMGNAAELCAKECEVPREAQDAFSIESYRRAQSAWKEGRFTDEVVPVSIEGRKGTESVAQDEEPFKTNFDKIPEGGDGHSGQFLKDQRRRSRTRCHDACRRRKKGLVPAREDRRLRFACAKAGVVYDRPCRRDHESTGTSGTDAGSDRLV